MRVVVLLLLLVAPTAAALAEDPAGDVSVTLDGEPTLGLQPRLGHLDLRSLTLEERPDALAFTLTLDDLRSDGVTFVDTVTHVLTFRIGTVDYVLTFVRGSYADSPTETSHGVSLWRAVAGDGLHFVSEYDVEVDEPAGTLAAAVPRVHLVDEAGAKAAPGTVLEDLAVTSRPSAGNGANLAGDLANLLLDELGVGGVVPRVEVQDRMPDAGALAYAVRTGAGVAQGMTLTVEEPARLSNGEATTLLFVVRVRNDQEDPRALHFQQSGAPADWDVWFPAQGAALGAGEAREVPVLVRMPFVHQHGARNEFTLRVSDPGDPDVFGETQLAVEFTAVPQPSGHHPRLWIHTAPSANDFAFHGDDVRGGRSEPFLNAREEDGDGSPAASNGPVGPNRTLGWRVPLAPGLGMGLHFIEGGEGELSFTLDANNEPQSGLRLGGALVHVTALGNETVLARFQAAPVDLMPGESHEFSGPLVVQPGVGRIPYQPRANLELHLWPESDLAFGLQHSLLVSSDLSLRGGTLDLPLLEYHDDVDASFGDLRTLVLDAGVRERFVNPGETTLFDVRVTNGGATDRALSLRLLGDTAWATLLPETLTVPAGGSATVLVSVQVPADARDGEQADLVVEAVGADGVRALLRLVARVDSTSDHPDLSGQVPTASVKESPGAPALAGLLAVAVVAARARRRG